MPGLKLPSEEQAGLTKLQALSEDQASNLLTAIGSAAAKADVDDLTISDLPDIYGLPRADAQQIVETLVSLYHLRAYAEVEIDEFIDDICEVMEAAGNQRSVARTAVQEYRPRLTKFLSIEDVNIAAKSTVLRYEHERTVHSVRILTDARPVFGSDIKAAPEAAVIMHTLKIAFHEATNLREMFFALDEEDLKALTRAAERAELKAAGLYNFLAKAQIKVFKQS